MAKRSRISIGQNKSSSIGRVAKGLSLEQAEYTAAFLNAVAEGEFSETSNGLQTILGRKPMSLKETFAADL